MSEVLSLWRGVVTIPPPKPRMAEIAAMVAERHGLSLDTLRGPQRCRRVAHARQEAMALIYAQGRFSTPQIGRYFGDRDHTTVLYGINAHKARAERRGSWIREGAE
jgi:chromosomal replication initiator protein